MAETPMRKTNLQKFEVTTISRSSIKEHPRNPRTISDTAKKRLKEKLTDVGALEPPIVNRRTMYLIGGHQRLGLMDKHEGYPTKGDYLLDVAFVDLTEKQELEMLVFLNNPSAQGTWNRDLLAEINTEFGVSFAGMGFDKLDVDMLFDGDARFSDLFKDTAEVKEAKNSLEEIKAHRKESTKALQDANDANFYFVVVCKDKDEKSALLEKMGIPHHETTISAEAIAGLMDR